MGDALKKKFGGWTAYLFTADKAILKLMRLSPSRRIPLFNGAIECRLLEYKIVAGSNWPGAAARAQVKPAGGVRAPVKLSPLCSGGWGVGLSPTDSFAAGGARPTA